MHGLTAILLVSELSVKLQQNGLCKSPIILRVMYFWPEEDYHSQPQALDKVEQNIRDNFAAVPLEP